MKVLKLLLEGDVYMSFENENVDSTTYVPYKYFTQKHLSLEEENEMLKATIRQLQKELMKYRTPPYLVGSVVDVVKPDEVVVQLNTGKFYVKVAKELEGKVKVDDRVLLEQKSLTVLEVLGKEKPFDVQGFVVVEKPKVKWKDIGGLKEQIKEIREIIEMPLIKPQVFEKIGIEPPKGVLLYGPPGTGKTLLAKAAAAHSKATFIEIVGSELVQKYIGEGSKFVKSIFELAREKAPSIVFIDEVDAIAAKRIELGTSGEREVQRTFMQLLAEIDGFKPLGNVKIIAATNRLDILDPAITRPGRLDRIIEVGYPDEKGKLEILRIHTAKMNLGEDVDLEEIAKRLGKKVSGAEIKAVCTEAGYFALRRNATTVRMKDFENAIKKVLGKKERRKGNVAYLYG